MHILLSYVFIFLVLRFPGLKINRAAYLMLCYALVFLAISSFGPWALAVISAKGLAASPLYKASIYWFLHFTYNGWMTLGLLTVFIGRGMMNCGKYTLTAIHLLALSVGLTYVLSLLEFDPGLLWNGIGIFFALVQAGSLIYLLVPAFQKGSKTGLLMKCALSMLALKALMQVASGIPAMQTLSFVNRDVLIMYLHLVLVGWVSLGCLRFLLQEIPPAHHKASKAGVAVLTAGFAVQEVLLGCKALLPGRFDLWMHPLLLACALCMLMGAALLWAAYTGKAGMVRG